MKKPQVSGYEWVDRTLNNYSFLYRRVSRLLSRHPMGIYYRKLPLEDQTELTPYKKNYSIVDQERVELLFAIIRKIKQFSDNQGIKLLLVEGVYGKRPGPSTQGMVGERVR